MNNMPKSENSGIYMIYNINNHKAYIGQTVNFRGRAITHRSDLLTNRHQCKALQDDFNSGMEFCFAILRDVGKECDKGELLILERWYIYSLLNKGIRLYNHETEEQLKDIIFNEMFGGIKDGIQKEMDSMFGCPMRTLKCCNISTLKDKFRALEECEMPENMIKNDKQ